MQMCKIFVCFLVFFIKINIPIINKNKPKNENICDKSIFKPPAEDVQEQPAAINSPPKSAAITAKEIIKIFIIFFIINY